jgi:hypothetical protein
VARNDWVTFQEFGKDLGDKTHALASDTLKLGIVDATITPTANDETPVWGDYSANDVSEAGGYVADGIALTGVTWTEAAGVATLDDTVNVTLAQDALGFEDGYWGILYNSTAATDECIGFLDLGGPVSEVAGSITITWHASGILKLEVNA